MYGDGVPIIILQHIDENAAIAGRLPAQRVHAEATEDDTLAMELPDLELLQGVGFVSTQA